jgi:hypothetical protein
MRMTTHQLGRAIVAQIKEPNGALPMKVVSVARLFVELAKLRRRS